MNIHKHILAFCAALFLATGCFCGTIVFKDGDGTIIVGTYSETGGDWSEERQVEGFMSIESEAPFNVHFIQADTPRVLVEGMKEFVDKVVTKVVDGKLVISLENGKYTNLVLKVTVWAPDIREFYNTGSGDMFIDGSFNALGDLAFHSTGSGNFNVQETFCGSLSVSSKGSGDFEAEMVNVNGNASFETSGSGDMAVKQVHVLGDLNLLSTGSGDVMLAEAACEILSAKTSGSGDFKAGKIDVIGSASFASSGSGDIAMKRIDVLSDLKLTTSGSGDIAVTEGSCVRLSTNSTGSGDITGRISCESSSQHSTGSGDCEITQ